MYDMKDTVLSFNDLVIWLHIINIRLYLQRYKSNYSS